MKLNIYKHFRFLLLILFSVASIVIVVNALEEASGVPPRSLFANSAVICYFPVFLRQHFCRSFRVSNPIFTTISLYVIGVLFLACTRSDLSAELPRAFIMSISIWSGLMFGSCIGKNRRIINDFMVIVLLFGVSASIISIFTGVGVVSAIEGFSIGRANRLWTIAFGVIDPVCMFASGLYLWMNPSPDLKLWKKKVYKVFTVLAFLLILYSSTRSFLIELVVILAFAALSKVPLSLRVLATPLCIGAVFLIGYWLTNIVDFSKVSVLSNFGFVDNSGQIRLESYRASLYEYLFQVADANPFTGIGINEVKETTLSLGNAAKTEYGYYLHIASFGFIVSTPFYLVMLFGGLLRPFTKLLTLSRRSFAKSYPIYGTAVACFLAGFSGYYAQATAISQFTALIFVGIATSYDPIKFRLSSSQKLPQDKLSLADSIVPRQIDA